MESWGQERRGTWCQKCLCVQEEVKDEKDQDEEDDEKNEENQGNGAE